MQVLFQNDSPATLLARVIGIIGSIDQNMLAKGRDTYKYFTKNHMLYERNQVYPFFLFIFYFLCCVSFTPEKFLRTKRGFELDISNKTNTMWGMCTQAS